MPGLHIKASAEVPSTADIAAIVLAAGGELKNAHLSHGVLTIRGVEQATLDAVLAGGVDTLFASRATKIQAVDDQLATRTDAGMSWRGQVLQIGPESLADVTSAALAANLDALPSGFAWRMASNEFLTMTPEQMIEMATAAFAYVYGMYVWYWALKGGVAAAADQAAIDAINPATGWPTPAVATL